METLILPEGYAGFAIHRASAKGYEEQTVMASATIHKIPIKVVPDATRVPSDFIPVGNVPFTQEVFGSKIKPNYYPAEYSDFLRRKIWYSDKWPLGQRVFVKPADEHKRFTGFVTRGTYSKKKKGPLVISEVIAFKNEWRYYLGSGLTQGFWYAGRNEELAAPDLPKQFYSNVGCLDMGETLEGELTLVEWQPAFSCGWYGKGVNPGILYTNWVAKGYAEVKKSLNQGAQLSGKSATVL